MTGATVASDPGGASGEEPQMPGQVARVALPERALVASLAEVVRMKLDASGDGWSPRLRRRFGYHTPDEMFEATMNCLVRPGIEWLDVGCGEHLMPANPALGPALAQRAGRLAGVDPSGNILLNPLLHERFHGVLEEYAPDRPFDLVSLRMVAEHVTDPASFVAALARATRPGGLVVVYTVFRWSPASVVADLTPFRLHHAAKRWLWEVEEERHTFPTAYKLNTRGALARAFETAGFDEAAFRYLDDCRSLARWKTGSLAELALWRALRAVGLPYPEGCILGLYRRG